MPVTAKLSQKFHERLGDDIAAELVDWFNSVDAEYQRQYREANDLNWERFKAFHRAELSEFRREVESTISRSEKGSQAQFDALRGDFLKLRTDFSDLRSDLMKWMFVYWSGSMIGVAGLVVALLKLR